uniref:Transmembrane 9 superfamily member n=1 Tax=Hucho hucho TaxID=62062 RepID=A0A4W5KLW5_9TELE
MGCILPFGCIFIQVEYFHNILSHQTYYMFGFLFLFHLCAHIHTRITIISLCLTRWWWYSFLTSLFMAVYQFVYDMLYFFFKLQIISVTTTILHFTMIMVLIFFLFTRESTTMPHYEMYLSLMEIGGAVIASRAS